MASLLENIDKLKFWCAELEPRRSLDPLANDVYEEAADLRELAETILRGTHGRTTPREFDRKGSVSANCRSSGRRKRRRSFDVMNRSLRWLGRF